MAVFYGCLEPAREAGFSMIGLLTRRREVAQQRFEAQANFEAYEGARRRRDEITDQSERLASPMVNTYEYHLKNIGLVTDLDEPMAPVFEDGLRVAQAQASIDARWQFEAVRRGIEKAEFHEITDYANMLGEGVRITSLTLDGSDYEGARAIGTFLNYPLPDAYPGSEWLLENRIWTSEGLVVLSPIPDAVRVDGVDIGAYDPKRAKMIVRIMTPLGTPLSEHDELIDDIRRSYDSVLTARTGQQHYAGRQQLSNEDAKTFIERQPDLIDAHMDIIGKIFAATNDVDERNRLAAPHRYNFAAALDDRLQGRQVASLSGSGDAARAEGRTFDGDCPTAASAASAGQQADRLGYTVEKWSQGTCRNCERTTQVWKTEDGGCCVCRDCAAAHTRKGDAGLEQERKKAVAERTRSERIQRRAQKLGAKALAVGMSLKQKLQSQKRPDYIERMAIGGVVREKIEEE